MAPLVHQQIASPTPSSATASFIDRLGSRDVAGRHEHVSNKPLSHTGPSRHKQENHRFHPYDKALQKRIARKKRRMLALDDSLDALATLIEKMDIRKIPLHGTATLPLELLVICGQFLAGQNSYATLASLALGNKLLKREITPILYETLILDEKKGWWRMGITDEEVLAETTEEHRRNFMFTKYLVLGPSVVTPFSFHVFPRCAAVIYHVQRHPEFLLHQGWHSLPNQSWSMYIAKPVTASTLAELFAIPVRMAGSRLLQSIQSLSQVTVGNGGRVVGKLRDRWMLPLGNATSMLTIAFSSTKTIATSTEIANTTQQLLHLLRRSKQAGHLAWKLPCFCGKFHVSATAAITTIRITLPAGDQDALKACLKGLKTAICSCLNLDVMIHLICATSAQTELEDSMHTAAEFYQKLWPLLKSKPAIFSLRYMRPRYLLLKTFTDYGSEPETAGFDGILSPHTEDSNSFDAISYRRLERGDREEVYPARRYTAVVNAKV